MLSNFRIDYSTHPEGLKRKLVSGNWNTSLATVCSQCFVCHWDRCDSRRRVVDRRKLR